MKWVKMKRALRSALRLAVTLAGIEMAVVAVLALPAPLMSFLGQAALNAGYAAGGTSARAEGEPEATALMAAGMQGTMMAQGISSAQTFAPTQTAVTAQAVPRAQAVSSAQTFAPVTTISPALQRELDGPPPGVSTRAAKGGRPSGPCTVTEFRGETPGELSQAFAHPRLAGWSCLCGATLVREAQSKNSRAVDWGLAAFGRGDERLLVMLFRETGADWRAVPVGEKALLRGRELWISCDAEEGRFLIGYPVGQAGLERFAVAPVLNEAHQALCRLVEYRSLDAQTGAKTVIDGEGNSPDGLGRWYHVTVSAPRTPPVQETIATNVPPFLDFWDAERFPKTLSECRESEGLSLPEGYGVTLGVHLRAKTSSRSKDLGTFEPGCLVRVLDILPGDPNPWVRVQIGALEGYMSGLYVRYEGLKGAPNNPFSHVPLRVATNPEAIPLKKGTGWLSGTQKQLAAGCRMRVLATCGDWLYVSVCSGEPGWLMDVQDECGYVKASQVVQAATAVQLDWLEDAP